MYIQFKGIYHHDTFDDTLSLVFEADSLDMIKYFAQSRNIVILHCEASDTDPKNTYHYFVRFLFEDNPITVWWHRDTINDSLENVATWNVHIVDANTKNMMYSAEQIQAKIKKYSTTIENSEKHTNTSFQEQTKDFALHDPEVSRYQKIAEKTLALLPLQRQKFEKYISPANEKKLARNEIELQKLKRSTNREKIRILIDEIIHILDAIEVDYLTGITKKTLIPWSRVQNIHAINALDHYQRSIQAKEIHMVDTRAERWYTIFGQTGIYLTLMRQEFVLRFLHDKKEQLVSRFVFACWLSIIFVSIWIVYQDIFVASGDSSILWLHIIGIAFIWLVAQALQRTQKIAFGWKVCILVAAFIVYSWIRYRIGSYFVLF